MIRIQPGDRLRFGEERNGYTVQAVSTDGRWAVCTKPFKARRTVIYTVVDFVNDVRGVDNLVFGLGYETREDCEAMAALFEAGDAEHSARRHPPIPLRVTHWVTAKA